MPALENKLRDRNLSVEGLQSQLKAMDDFASGHHKELQTSNVAINRVVFSVVSLYSILLRLCEQLEKSEKRDNGLHDWSLLRSNSCKEKTTDL